MTHFSLGLIGHPLEHSISPRLHNAALRAMGKAGEYRLYPIEPFPRGELALKALLDKVRTGELQGLNVTIPHKQNVVGYLDELTAAALTIGAANTVFRDGEHLVGDNTDAPGFMLDLKRVFESRIIREKADQDVPGRHALVLGAGGSARAVTYALINGGWKVTVSARRPEQARELALSFQGVMDGERVQSIPLDSLILNHQSTIHLLVNATPVGMYPQVDASPWPHNLSFPDGVVVYDLVYNPPETILARSAAAAGCLATTGLGMLVEQAALALERWTEGPVPRSPMWAAVPEFRISETPKDNSA